MPRLTIILALARVADGDPFHPDAADDRQLPQQRSASSFVRGFSGRLPRRYGTQPSRPGLATVEVRAMRSHGAIARETLGAVADCDPAVDMLSRLPRSPA